MSYANASYEDMTVDGLRSLAKVRGYCGCSRMRKQELCDVLRRGDYGQYDGKTRAKSPARSPARSPNAAKKSPQRYCGGGRWD